MTSKKKFLILLSILSVMLFVGSFSSCYAWQLPKSNIEPGPFITKYGGSMTTDQKNKFTNNMNRFLSETNYDTYLISIGGRGSSVDQSYINGFNKSDINGNITNVNNLNYMSIPLQSNSGKAVYLTGNYSVVNISNGCYGLSGSQLRGKYIFWSNDLSDSVTGPHETSEILGPFQEPSYFVFTYPANSNAYTINGMNNTYYSITSGYQIYLGSLFDSSNTGFIEYRIGSWNGRNYQFNMWDTWFAYDRDGFFPAWAPATTTQNDGRYTTYLYFNTNNNNNNIFEFKFRNRLTEDLTNDEPIYAYFYCLNGNTNIVNGVIYPNNTFSGDYNQQYEQQQQNNNIIGSITDSINDLNNNNNENTDRIIDSISTFNSGDTSMINFGNEPGLTDPSSNFVTYLLNRITTIFLGDYTNSYLDIPFYSTTYRVRASQLYLPSALYTLISMIVLIWFFRGYFMKIRQFVLAVQTANIGSFAEKVKGGLSVVDML